MLKIKTLTLKNFMSIGNATQVIDFQNDELTLIIGENLDLGGNDNRNGVGKTSIVNGLCFALFGNPLSNIKIGNLINLSNEKHMYVTVEFEKDGNSYKIERGRKPSVFKYFVNNVEKNVDAEDEAQGDSRVTQHEIEKNIGIGYEMFKQIVTLTTSSEPFLSMRANDQRNLIEQLLGITKLSEKAEKLRDLIRETKDSIKEEELTLKAKTEANKSIELNIKNLKIKNDTWVSNHLNSLEETKIAIDMLENLNIEYEIESHNNNALYTSYDKDIKSFARERLALKSLLVDLTTKQQNILKELEFLNNETCPTCEQEIHTSVHEDLLKAKTQELEDTIKKIDEKTSSIILIEEKINSIPKLDKKTTFYKTLDEAYSHKSSLETLKQVYENELNQTNPYTSQIESLSNDGLQEINFEKMNNLTQLRDHQEFLLKLLSNKDSFIRKKIIEQNISYLNTRLTHYLEKIGLPHKVKFNSDLTVVITDLGRELDFDNLSRGEKTRLILSLSWAFRDVYESLNGKINIMFIDELIDNGLDGSGVENALHSLKFMSRELKRNIFLISHREELLGRVDNILKIVKENGFTTIEVQAN